LAEQVLHCCDTYGPKARESSNKLKLTKFVKTIFSVFGLAISKEDYFRKIEQSYLSDPLRSIDLSPKLGYTNCNNLVQDLKNSRAQHSQDLVALSINNFKREGFFVEFGATNGVDISNTYLLEKNYGWTGILAEPARAWHKELARNRTAQISHECVWKESGQEVTFVETEIRELSTVEEFQAHDLHASARSNGNRYKVPTTSLDDLLKKFNAPKRIDFLSIDTEGSEFFILENFDFSYYEIGFISVEHNFTANRNRIYDLLVSKGFKRVLTQHSSGDDWYEAIK
jgi:FkbM family methyltransferase